MNLLMAFCFSKVRARGMDHDGFVGALTWMNAANMYFQSFGAVSIVKVNAPWFHVRERGVLGGVFGILISLGLYFAYDGSRILAGEDGSRMVLAFVVPAAILLLFFAIDVLVIRDTPSAAGFKDFDTADTSSGDPRTAHVLGHARRRKSWVTPPRRPGAFGAISRPRSRRTPSRQVRIVGEDLGEVVRDTLLDGADLGRREQVAAASVDLDGGAADVHDCGQAAQETVGVPAAHRADDSSRHAARFRPWASPQPTAGVRSLLVVGEAADASRAKASSAGQDRRSDRRRPQGTSREAEATAVQLGQRALSAGEHASGHVQKP
jgi:hypothetical protein